MSVNAQTILQRAHKFARTGQFDLAEEEYATLLARYPANKRAKAGLKKLRQLEISPNTPSPQMLAQVRALLEKGHYSHAKQAAFSLVTRFPNNAMAQNFLGIAYAAGPQPQDAVTPFQRALMLDPDNVDIAYNLGNLYRDLGEHVQALDAYATVIQLRPNFPQAYNNIGVSLNMLGQRDAAITAYDQALLLEPNSPNALRNLGKAHYDNADYTQAISYHLQAMALTPDCADIALSLANAYYFDGQHLKAVETLENAIALRPDFPVALNNLGAVLRGLGHMEKARSNFEKAVVLRPNYAEAHYNLSTLKHFKAGDAQIETLHALEKTGALSEAQDMYLQYALAKAHKDLREWSRSFAYLEQGNASRRRQIGYDIAADNDLFARIRGGFENGVPLLTAPPNNTPLGNARQHSRATPIFILGMPRSGTTLTEQILASHDDVRGAGELDFLTLAIRNCGWKGGTPTTDHLAFIRHSYLENLNNSAYNSQFITDKMPINFRFVGFILAAIPEAKIIHTNRDARATCWSIYSHFFSESGKGNGFANDQIEVATYYRMYQNMMAFWHKRFPGKIYDLNYESLTENQTGETRKLLDFVGLDWQDQCLDFHNTNRTVKTASATQVRQKMYQGSSEKWRRYADHLGPMIEILKQC